ncbi:TetR/AcrR family transcriptional regulator [Paenibacillus sp. FSL R7-0345]|uniref:TetR/AcrR family transcriptional regulator n=1 Tax=Paenibacillus sp. FSL R7-0345 TaxID=2954535 RepID=UPI003159C3E4
MAKNKQEDIYAAAMQLFAARGYDGTTVPMIAEQAKVGAGTIYRYFENKEALVNSLITDCVRKLTEVIRTGFPEHEPVRMLFTHIYSRVFDYARNNFDAFLFINTHDDAYYLDEQSRQVINELMAFIGETIELGQQQNEIRKLPTCALIAIVYAPISMMIKQIQNDVLIYSEELYNDLEDSAWNAICIR